MDFFGKVGEKVSNAGSAVIGKVNEVGNTTGLNNQIIREEKLINDRFLQMGKLYYEKYKNNYESDFGPMIEAIKHSEEVIKGLKEQVNSVKHIVLCPNCKAENPDTGKFCVECGTPLVKQQVQEANKKEEVALVICSNCGQQIPENNKFCVNCGTPVVKPANVVTKNEEQKEETTDVEIEEISVTIEEPVANICPQCGSVLDDDARFCTNCGRAVQ